MPKPTDRPQDNSLDLLNEYMASDFKDEVKLEQAIAIQRALSASYEAGVKPERYGDKVPLTELFGFNKPQPTGSTITRRLK